MIRDFPIVSEYVRTPGLLRELYPNVQDFFRNISVPFDSSLEFFEIFGRMESVPDFNCILGIYVQFVIIACINLKYFIAK